MDADETILGHWPGTVGNIGTGVIEWWRLLFIFHVFGLVLFSWFGPMHDPKGSYRSGRIIVTSKNLIFFCGYDIERALIYIPLDALTALEVRPGFLCHEIACTTKPGEVTRWWFGADEPDDRQRFYTRSRFTCKKVLGAIERAKSAA